MGEEPINFHGHGSSYSFSKGEKRVYLLHLNGSLRAAVMGWGASISSRRESHLSQWGGSTSLSPGRNQSISMEAGMGEGIYV